MAQLTRPTKTKLFKLIGVIIAVCSVALFVLLKPSNAITYTHKGSVSLDAESQAGSEEEGSQASASKGTEAESSLAENTAQIVVHVDGEVVNPGVYELAENSRVQQAVDAAGGLTSEANLTSVNLAAPISDGQKIYIPNSQDIDSAVVSSQASIPTSSSNSSSSLVNINTATADELDNLPGVGPSTAAAIIHDREAIGAFSSIEDLMRVSGIGEAKFEKLKDYICV